ncbi:hypothetical protein RB195_021732 [Necator americanus]|uniref:Uncharacterized protein n=1 Tax=Necator americanus TaxID=51031 RepID=A0ABR1ECF8_NECAM
MGLEQQSDVFGKWFYAMEQTSSNGSPLIDLCEPTNLIIAHTACISSLFKRTHRRRQLMWQGTTPLTTEGQRKRKEPNLNLQLDYVLTKNILLSEIQKSRVDSLQPGEAFENEIASSAEM